MLERTFLATRLQLRHWQTMP